MLYAVRKYSLDTKLSELKAVRFMFTITVSQRDNRGIPGQPLSNISVLKQLD